jgi:protein-L-isoaspartate(D-aspartate) O-methyltransferase
MKRFINFSKQLETTSELRDLIEALKDLKFIRSTIVEKTLLSVDRRVFCPQNPYNNHKTDIGFGAEFNSPVIDSIVLEALKNHLVVGAQILDIGSCTGYLSVCMAMMCANQCKVIAIEHIPELIEKAKINSRIIFGENNCIDFIEGDGRSGYPSLGPYDVINVGVSFEELPQILLNQLKVCGRMCCPIGSECGPQDLTIIDKLSDGSIERQSLIKVSLKPITKLNKQIYKIV